MSELGAIRGDDAFCTKPQRPLSRRARDLCPLAGELTACAAFAEACSQEKLPEPKVEQSSWSEALKSALAAIAKIVLRMGGEVSSSVVRRIVAASGRDGS